MKGNRLPEEVDRFLFVHAYALAQPRFHTFLLHTLTQQSLWHPISPPVPTKLWPCLALPQQVSNHSQTLDGCNDEHCALSRFSFEGKLT